jgi:hypothetical protein
MRYGTFASLVTLLALLTGLCLGQLVTLERPAASHRAVSIADARVGAEFYRSINAYLSAGDATALDRVIDPALRTNLPGLTAGAGLAGLTGYLDRVRAVDPAFQLIPGAMQTFMQGITSQISFQSAAAVSVAGLPVSPASFWGSSDYLELRAGRVIALWTSIPATVQPLLEPSRTVTSPSPEFIEPTLERWSLKPHIVYRPESGQAPTILRVLAGAALISIEREGDGAVNTRWTSDATEPEPLRAGEPVQLGRGDVVGVAPLAKLTIVAQGIDPAELVVVTQERTASTDTLARESHRESDGVPRLILARGAPRTVAGGSLSLDTLALDLPVGAESLAHQSDRYEIVFVVSGQLRLTVEHGKAWQANPDRTAVRIAGSVVIDAGSGVVIDRGSGVSFEPLDGAATLWFVTLTSG